jgi:protein TonB
VQPDKPRLGGALGVSAAIHLGVLAIVLAVMSAPRGPVASEVRPDVFQYVHVVSPGPSGGGGANNAPAPPRPVEIPPHRAPEPVPVVTPPAPPVEPPPMPRLDAPIQTDLGAVLQTPGTTLGAQPGPGGRNPGTGAGDGDRGPGVNRGRDGSTGGGPHTVGGDVIGPQIVRQPQPRYTPQAMQAKIQGSVTLEAVVRADGTVGEVRVVKSLDPKFGLDAEAVASAKQWLFRPGTHKGQPVDVLVTLVLDFRIH